MLVQRDVRHDSHATGARLGCPKAGGFQLASFLQLPGDMGSSQKFWLALIVLLPGGLILGPVIWFVQRWWRQRSLAAHPSLPSHPTLQSPASLQPHPSLPA
jgi:hypothetical protein